MRAYSRSASTSASHATHHTTPPRPTPRRSGSSRSGPNSVISLSTRSCSSFVSFDIARMRAGSSAPPDRTYWPRCATMVLCLTLYSAMSCSTVWPAAKASPTSCQRGRRSPPVPAGCAGLRAFAGLLPLGQSLLRAIGTDERQETVAVGCQLALADAVDGQEALRRLREVGRHLDQRPVGEDHVGRQVGGVGDLPAQRPQQLEKGGSCATCVGRAAGALRRCASSWDRDPGAAAARPGPARSGAGCRAPCPAPASPGG